MTASLTAVRDTWRTVTGLWKKHPVLLMPFILVGVSYIVVLALLFLAPRFPLSLFLAPVISAFWGEHFLHYPFNLLLLPQLFNYGKTAVDLACGVLMTGTAVAMLQQAYRDVRPGWSGCLKNGARKYGRVALVWLAMFLAAIAAIRFIGWFLPPATAGALSLAFLAGALVQMLFVFAIPAIIVENRQVLPAIRHSFALCGKFPFESIFFILLPHVLFIPFIYALLHLSGIMDSLAPEAALYMLALRILLAVALDLLVISVATVLLLRYGEREYGSARA